MNADGFTMNFSIANDSPGRAFSLALKGVNSHTGSFNKTTSTLPTSDSYWHWIYPYIRSVLFSSFMDTAQATVALHARYGIGGSDGTTEGSSSFQDTASCQQQV